MNENDATALVTALFDRWYMSLLAYLDGELSRARTRAIHNHLKSCWNCRFVLADPWIAEMQNAKAR